MLHNYYRVNRQQKINPAFVTGYKYQRDEGGFSVTFKMSGTDDVRIPVSTADEAKTEIANYEKWVKKINDELLQHFRRS